MVSIRVPFCWFAEWDRRILMEITPEMLERNQPRFIGRKIDA
jgi:hypothetical protein